MDEIERRKYEAKSQELRADLKRFEGDWAKRNHGAKPGRNDIKQNPDIAQKYKKYNQVRDILAGKISPPKPKDRSQKRKPDEAPPQSTPSKKRAFLTETPSKSRHADIQPPDTPQFETPSIRRLFSPKAPTSIGPTPQKDGRILGLFDLLVENDENKTPSKSKAGREHADIQATPSKKANNNAGIDLGSTPVSSRKRNASDAFLTPLKNRDNNNSGIKTPSSSVSKLQFATPSFLRRAPQPLSSVDENGEYVETAVPPLRLPRKPLGRSLSSVVASLRKMEEEKHDDDLEALREMEEEEQGNAPPRPAPAQKKTPADQQQAPTDSASKKEEALIPDSQQQDGSRQPPRLLGGFDDEGLLDSDPEEQLGRDGQPLHVYKKKGQKRTTRRVNMKPTRYSRPTTQAAAAEHEDSDGDGVVPETQVAANGVGRAENPLESGSEFEEDELAGGGGDGDYDEASDQRSSKKRKTAATGSNTQKNEKQSAASSKETRKRGTDKADQEEGEGRIRKAARKVNELAHTNFKRLKLRNHGSKGGPGFGSRFRRRR